jgi:hypothetical protein
MTHITETEFVALVGAAAKQDARIKQLEEALGKAWQLSLTAQAEIDDGVDPEEAVETLVAIVTLAHDTLGSTP